MKHPLAALDAHLRQQNDNERRRVFGDAPRRRHRHETAETAPMPEAAGICRWCRGRLTALKAGEPATYCHAGCAPNDVEPYLGHCQDCGRDFRTGRRHTETCYACERKNEQQIAAHTQAARTPTVTRDEWAERRRG